MGRAAELIVLAHRKYLRHHRHNRSERVIKSRWDAILVEPDHPLGIKTSRSLVRGYEEVLDLLPRKVQRKLDKVTQRVHDMDENFAQIEKLVDMYLPFMYESFYVFKADALDRHAPVEAEFSWGPELYDWRKYWIDVHVPGLRRWAFPLIEGKRPERYRAQHKIRLSEPKSSSHDDSHTSDAVSGGVALSPNDQV